MIFPIHAFLSRHSFSTRRSLVRRLVSVGGSLIRTADQARGKVRGVKWACAYRGVIVWSYDALLLPFYLRLLLAPPYFSLLGVRPVNEIERLSSNSTFQPRRQ